MAEQVEMGIQDAREQFRTVVDDALVRRKPTVITRHGVAVAAVVPYDWFQQHWDKTDHDGTPNSSA